MRHQPNLIRTDRDNEDARFQKARLGCRTVFDLGVLRPTAWRVRGPRRDARNPRRGRPSPWPRAHRPGACLRRAACAACALPESRRRHRSRGCRPGTRALCSTPPSACPPSPHSREAESRWRHARSRGARRRDAARRDPATPPATPATRQSKRPRRHGSCSCSRPGRAWFARGAHCPVARARRRQRGPACPGRCCTTAPAPPTVAPRHPHRSGRCATAPPSGSRRREKRAVRSRSGWPWCRSDSKAPPPVRTARRRAIPARVPSGRPRRRRRRPRPRPSRAAWPGSAW